MNAIARSITLAPRNYSFETGAVQTLFWNGASPSRTFFFDALSILFPRGERFFMDSFKAFRSQITDPVLLAQVNGFLSQAAIHTREHVDYNNRLKALGIDITPLDERLQRRLERLRQVFTPLQQLAATCAFEHFTAIIADEILTRPDYFKGSDTAFQQLWQWHALEETEHKAVAYDVYKAVSGPNGYWPRIKAMIQVTIAFNQSLFIHYRYLSRQAGLPVFKATLGLIWVLFGRPGMVRRTFLRYAQFFLPGFHPWHHDNRKALKRAQAWYDKALKS